MLRQWQSTVPLSIEINWNLKLKIATWPYNAIHSPTRTSRTGSWSSNQTNPVTLETRSVQRSKLSHGRGDLDWQPNETFYLWSTCIFFPICVKRGNPPQCRHANAESILSYCCYNIDIEITWSYLDVIWFYDIILWYYMMRYIGYMWKWLDMARLHVSKGVHPG